MLLDMTVTVRDPELALDLLTRIMTNIRKWSPGQGMRKGILKVWGSIPTAGHV